LVRMTWHYNPPVYRAQCTHTHDSLYLCVHTGQCISCKMLPLVISLFYCPLSTQFVPHSVLPYSAYADFIEKREEQKNRIEAKEEIAPDHFLAAIEMMKNGMVSSEVYHKKK
jgi:hypothetical protein